jgi:hypothetical protein
VLSAPPAVGSPKSQEKNLIPGSGSSLSLSESRQSACVKERRFALCGLRGLLRAVSVAQSGHESLFKYYKPSKTTKYYIINKVKLEGRSVAVTVGGKICLFVSTPAHHQHSGLKESNATRVFNWECYKLVLLHFIVPRINLVEMARRISLIVDQMGDLINARLTSKEEIEELSVKPKSEVKCVTQKYTPSILLTNERREERLSRRKVLKKVYFNIPESGTQEWKFKPINPNSHLLLRWNMFMLLPLGYEVWAFPYRLALGVPSISSQMTLTTLDFAIDIIFLIDMMLALSTIIPKSPGREKSIVTFDEIASNYFQNTFLTQFFPAFPYWVVTFIATNHLQDPGICGRKSSSGAVHLHWSCVIKNRDWPIWLWWLGSALRLIPRLGRLLNDFKTMESNLVRPFNDCLNVNEAGPKA